MLVGVTVCSHCLSTVNSWCWRRTKCEHSDRHNVSTGARGVFNGSHHVDKKHHSKEKVIQMVDKASHVPVTGVGG